ncbi:polysaccharide biosynthesis/export family protein [uncultured Brevundimonas sp.]|uniref:polysaccharide biosynthesis/export family protein n=1 Tax=uncultured Brevundimonas sp. TaxID=213418 RepID=UPI0025F11B86|nr:polysaccharide biosynthesis/export family protein [uncultured Brevundimonas sp.]
MKTHSPAAWMTALILTAAAAAAPTSAAPLQTSERTVPEYRLGSGDRVRVTVFGEEALGGTFVVDGAGAASLPLIGEVRAGGLTVAEFRDAVTAALRDGYLHEPRVSAEVVNHRPFYILGEVNRPGEYPYAAGLTVMNAAATAGGFTYRANTRRVFIKRADDTAEQAHPLTGSTPVAPGDTLRIGERYF